MLFLFLFVLVISNKLVPNGAAYRCGKIRVDDIFVSIDGQYVTSIQEAKVRGGLAACSMLIPCAESDRGRGGIVYRPRHSEARDW